MTEDLWKNAALESPPKDRPLFMLAKLNADGESVGTVVGAWSESNYEWRPTVHDLGTEFRFHSGGVRSRGSRDEF